MEGNCGCASCYVFSGRLSNDLGYVAIYRRPALDVRRLVRLAPAVNSGVPLVGPASAGNIPPCGAALNEPGLPNAGAGAAPVGAGNADPGPNAGDAPNEKDDAGDAAAPNAGFGGSEDVAPSWNCGACPAGSEALLGVELEIPNPAVDVDGGTPNDDVCGADKGVDDPLPNAVDELAPEA